MISTIIPAYKNTEELKRNLKNNLPYLEGYEVIVVNDDPERSIKKDLGDMNIILIENKKNLGFGGTVNVGVEKAKQKYVMLLNSDVVLGDSLFKNVLPNFEKNQNLFAVSFAQKEQGDRLVGKNKIFWDFGLVRHSKADDFTRGYTAWAEGGSSLFDKEKFIKLGGFDSLYSPFYWEDIDLSYRAWKAGYEILFDPSVVVNHHHESTIGKYFDEKKINRIAFRNQHIFMMKTVTDFNLTFSYWLLLVPNCVYFFFKKEVSFVSGLVDALKSYFKILEHRKKQRKYFILQDSKILAKFQ